MRRKGQVVVSISVVALCVLVYLIWMYVGLNQSDKDVVVILKSQAPSEFWNQVIEGAEKAADESHISYRFKASKDENDVEGQISLIRETILEKPDGVVLAATDFYKLESLTVEIKEAGIDLVLIDSGVEGQAYKSLVATDNYIAGYKVGNTIGDLMVEAENVVIINHVQGALTAMERERGAIEALKSKHPDVGIDVFYCFDDEEVAYKYIHQIINYGVPIDGVIGLNERSSVGAAKALDEYEDGLNIPMVGFDSSISEIQLLEKGIIDALIVQQPFNMGYTGMTTLIKAMNNETIKDRIDTGSKVITRANMFDPENRVILFPFSE